jgi:hypothetical protein
MIRATNVFWASLLVFSGARAGAFPARDEAAAARARTNAETEMADRAAMLIAAWPDESRRTAEAVIEKYGSPNAIGERVLVWNRRPPWKMILVHRADDAGLYPRRAGSLQQILDYDVPREKLAALDELDLGLSASPSRKELSATNESESINFLALNLADQVVAGRLTAAQARTRYVRTIILAGAGKSSPLMAGLTFVPRGPDGRP